MEALALALSLTTGLTTELEQRNLRGELGRFHHPAMMEHWARWAQGHLEYLEAIHGGEEYVPGVDINEVVARQRTVVRCYDLLHTARFGWLYSDRLAAAEKLKELIGKDWYDFGRLPTPLPVMERP